VPSRSHSASRLSKPRLSRHPPHSFRHCPVLSLPSQQPCVCGFVFPSLRLVPCRASESHARLTIVINHRHRAVSEIIEWVGSFETEQPIPFAFTAYPTTAFVAAGNASDHSDDVLTEEEKGEAVEGASVVLVGDMNAEPASSSIELFLKPSASKRLARSSAFLGCLSPHRSVQTGRHSSTRGWLSTPMRMTPTLPKKPEVPALPFPALLFSLSACSPHGDCG